MEIIKQWLFLRKLNKAIKGYGAKTHIDKWGELHIRMRNYNCSQFYVDLRRKYKTNQAIIDHIIKEIKIKNVEEAYE